MKHRRNNDSPATMSADSKPREEEIEEEEEEEEAYIHLPSLDSTDTRRHLISLTGKAFERQLLWRLDWWNFAFVIPNLLLLICTRVRCTNSCAGKSLHI